MKSRNFLSPPRTSSNQNSPYTKPSIDQQFMINEKTRKNKSLQPSWRRQRKVSVQVRTKFKISSQHLGFLIQQQKGNQLALIKQSMALNNYYKTLITLFNVIHSCSQQFLTKNILLQDKLEVELFSGLKFIQLFFNINQHIWNQFQLNKLKIISKNVMKMGNHKIYQQKIQFICRKITLNQNMKNKIQMSFVNTKLDSFWQSFISKLKHAEQSDFLQDLCQNSQQKMAYWDFNYFVTNYLSHQDFYQTLKQCNKNVKKQQFVQDTLLHDFTYEFVIIEIFCFHQEHTQKQSNKQISKDNCKHI